MDVLQRDDLPFPQESLIQSFSRIFPDEAEVCCLHGKSSMRWPDGFVNVRIAMTRSWLIPSSQGAHSSPNVTAAVASPPRPTVT